MAENIFIPSPEQFGVFWKFIEKPTVTDIDYNGSALWITDFELGRYRAIEEETELTPVFLTSFVHNIANSVNKQFNVANKILEADTRELRISIVHDSVTSGGVSICIRKSSAAVRNTLQQLIDDGYASEEVLQLLINCVRAKMNFVFGGEPGAGKTECAKFFMQFIPEEERVITIEDSFELHYRDIHPNADAVEMRVTPGYDYTDAIKACLRQNPAWLMLSEARSVEVTSLLEQWSTGVNGFTTIHLDDIRKLPDRILNMMNNVNDSARMVNRIYRYVNIGILIRCIRDNQGKMKRYIDQLGFFSRDEHENHIYMIVEDGEIVSRELPPDIKKKMLNAGIKEPYLCKDFDKLRKEQTTK